MFIGYIADVLSQWKSKYAASVGQPGAQTFGRQYDYHNTGTTYHPTYPPPHNRTQSLIPTIHTLAVGTPTCFPSLKEHAQIESAGSK